MAHTGQAVAGFALSFLAVTDQDGNREHEAEGYGYVEYKSRHTCNIIILE